MELKKETKPIKFTLIGCVALFIWAFSAFFVTNLSNLPLFETLTIALSISFLFQLIRNRNSFSFTGYQGNKKRYWVLSALCFNGNLLFYILAFKYAPPEQADLIVYLWPSLVIVFSHFFLPTENVQLKHIGALFIGILGITLLISNKTDLKSFSISSHLSGYAFAFLCALLWSIYMITDKKHAHTTSSKQMAGFYCGLGILPALTLHLLFETTVLPSIGQCVYLLIYGIAMFGLAYNFWEIGTRKGNFKLLTVLSYCNPVASVLLLVVFGKAEASPILGISSVLVVTSALIAGC